MPRQFSAEEMHAHFQGDRRLPRVLVIGHHIISDSMEWHIIDTLRAMGCPTQFFESAMQLGWAPQLAAQGIRKAANVLLREPERLCERRLVRVVRSFEPQLILVTLGSQLSPKTIRRVRALTDARIVCWCQDQMTTLGRQYLLGSEYDAVFVKDRHLQDLFSRMVKSTTFFYLPEACNPSVHRTLTLSGEEERLYTCDVMIAGTLYYYRQEILRHLTTFKLKTWGQRPDWLIDRLGIGHPGREVFMDDKAKAAAGARICLNALHYGEVNGLNARAFEIAGCGGFQLITAVPVLQEHFAVGSEIVAFRSTDELVELVRHYLEHPELAVAIGRRGQQRAYREHTYQHRLREIIRISLGQDLEIPAPAAAVSPS